MNKTPAETHALICDALERSRTSVENAASVADTLLAAELAGQGGHGLRRVASYAAQSKSGKVDGFAKPVANQAAPGLVTVDAANGFAYPGLDLAVERLVPLARSQGIAMAAVTRSHHCGVMGVTVERLAASGLVSLMFANTPAAMAPWGGTEAVFGTNPVAFAAPRSNGPPIVVDVALSAVARGKVMAAKQKGEPIPEGWAFGPDGKPATDPDIALAGTMAPLGGAKGTALALMVEILAASLIGANSAAHASSFFDAEGSPPGVGQTIIAIDPSRFGAHALDRIAALAEEIEAQENARLPGARRQHIRDALTVDGLEIEDDLLAQIEAIGRD